MATLVIFLMYWFVAALVVVDVGGTVGQIVTGWSFKDNAIADLVREDPSQYTPKKLMLDYGDPAAVWTYSSIWLATCLLFGSWFMMCGMMSASVAFWLRILKRSGAPKPTD